RCRRPALPRPAEPKPEPRSLESRHLRFRSLSTCAHDLPKPSPRIRSTAGGPGSCHVITDSPRTRRSWTRLHDFTPSFGNLNDPLLRSLTPSSLAPARSSIDEPTPRRRLPRPSMPRTGFLHATTTYRSPPLASVRLREAQQTTTSSRRATNPTFVDSCPRHHTQLRHTFYLLPSLTPSSLAPARSSIHEPMPQRQLPPPSTSHNSFPYTLTASLSPLRIGLTTEGCLLIDSITLHRPFGGLDFILPWPVVTYRDLWREWKRFGPLRGVGRPE
ncbi:hypothetical protein C0995_008018, partial [Termitomyces sp. Mi166